MTTIVFTGSIDPDSFAEFAAHRAQRLDLTSRLVSAGPQAVAITLEGEPDLIDAFEMACSLGPIDCLVRDVARVDAVCEGEHA